MSLSLSYTISDLTHLIVLEVSYSMLCFLFQTMLCVLFGHLMVQSQAAQMEEGIEIEPQRSQRLLFN